MTRLKRLLQVTKHDWMKNETVWSTPYQERTLVDRIAQRRLSWFGHVSKIGSKRLPVKVMHCFITGGINQGRQPKKWIENINQDIDMRNIKFDETMERRRTYLDTFDLSTHHY